jgi:hypothetical protein
MTRAEWGLIANECSMNDTLPHGNTNCGKYHGDECEHGDDTGKYGITKTGSGPATWTHNHKQGGIHDLCGNINEMVRGFRIKNGFLQIAKNNDAAMDIDLTAEGDGWENILDDNGKPIRVSFEERKIIFTTKDDAKHGCGGEQWENVVIDCKSEQLMELGLYHGELLAYCYIDATEGEYLPVCGGGWYNGSRAGVFNVRLSGPRSNSFGNIGFRSAYYRKLSTD